MMTDNLDATGVFHRAMSVMKMETIRFQRVHHFDVAAQLPIVIAGYHHDITMLGQISQQPGCFARRRFIMNEVAENDQASWFVLRDQCAQPIRNRGHTPHRDESTRRALTQFVTKMQVRHREPALGLMEKGEPPIEKNFLGDERLVWSKQRHRRGKLSLARFGINRY